MANYYDAVSRPVDIEPSETSYFSEPSGTLDPMLFQDHKLVSSIRNSILSMVLGALGTKFIGAETWARVWLAGSGVSYQWAAHRDPADLDCLVGIDYPTFRQMNPNYRGFSDAEIASEANELFSAVLRPTTENYLGKFDLTFYANVKSNILDIKPYAAYSLTDDKWTVEPRQMSIKRNPEWDRVAQSDAARASDILDRYRTHSRMMAGASSEPSRRNAEALLTHAARQGADLFDEIHEGRKQAFGSAGQGYEDFTNYRWQAGKETGIVPALKKLKETYKASKNGLAPGQYGVDLPDAGTLIRRAVTQNVRNTYG